MDYTAHVQVPDAAIGAVLHSIVLEMENVVCATLRSGNGTWLSFGLQVDSDDQAAMLTSTIRYHASQPRDMLMPDGYDEGSLKGFETAPLIVTCGRVVIHSEGI
jgi:hypothetical protein